MLRNYLLVFQDRERDQDRKISVSIGLMTNTAVSRTTSRHSRMLSFYIFLAVFFSFKSTAYAVNNRFCLTHVLHYFDERLLTNCRRRYWKRTAISSTTKYRRKFLACFMDRSVVDKYSMYLKVDSCVLSSDAFVNFCW